MGVRGLAKSLFRRVGLDVVQYVPDLVRPFPVLPLLVREHLAAGRPFFFVQVGANDGVLDDGLRELVVAHKLPGMMIEPQPAVFEKLRANYRDQPGLVFENVAVANEEGTRSLYCPTADAPNAEWSGLASFDRNHLRKQGVPAEHIREVAVPVVRLNTLLAKHKVEAVGLLQVDVEGFDDVIVGSALESGVFPAIINYEHCHLPPHARLACKQRLAGHGYSFLEVGKDTLAVRNG